MRECAKINSYHCALVLANSAYSAKFQEISHPSIPKSSIFLTNVGFISSEICDNIISWTEEHNRAHGGWTTNRHYAVPTTDIPVADIPSVLNWFNGFFTEELSKLLCEQFRGIRDHLIALII